MYNYFYQIKRKCVEYLLSKHNLCWLLRSAKCDTFLAIRDFSLASCLARLEEADLGAKKELWITSWFNSYVHYKCTYSSNLAFFFSVNKEFTICCSGQYGFYGKLWLLGFEPCSLHWLWEVGISTPSYGCIIIIIIILHHI